MPTYTRPLKADPLQTGLGAALAYTVYAVDGTTVLKARTAGAMTELAATAIYLGSASGWDTAWSGQIVWDAGAGPIDAEIFLASLDGVAQTPLVGTPTSDVIAGVWDLTTTGHTGAGSFGAAMSAAGTAGDPWIATLPGIYAAGTAGYVVGTNLNATVGSRLATSGYTAPANPATVVLATAQPNYAPAKAGDAMTLSLTQTGLVPRALDAVADSALTVGDALVAALAGAAGKESVVGTAYLVKTPFTGTVIRTFTLNNAIAPTARS